MKNSIIEIIKQAKDKALMNYFKSEKENYIKGYDEGKSIVYMYVLDLLEKEKVEKKLKALEILKPRIKLVKGTLTNDGIR